MLGLREKVNKLFSRLSVYSTIVGTYNVLSKYSERTGVHVEANFVILWSSRRVRRVPVDYRRKLANRLPAGRQLHTVAVFFAFRLRSEEQRAR